MKTRAEQLSQRIENGFETLAKYAERLSESQWSTMIPPDGRRASVIIHVASVYPIEVHLAKEVALGKAIEGIIWRRLEQRSRMSEAALGSIAGKSAAA
jgi:hypothetical protein